jgi:hypothetical protein
MIIAGIGIFSMLWMDRLIFTGNPGLISGMLIARSCYVLVTALFIYVVGKTNRVRVFDRLILGWLAITVLFMLVFNFIRPVSYQSTAFDAIVIFSIYALSPLQLRQNIWLVLGYSAGILFINYLFKTGTDPLTLSVAVSAQVIVHVLGLGSALQMQSYRRKSFKAYIDERDAKEMVAYLANIDPLT